MISRSNPLSLDVTGDHSGNVADQMDKLRLRIKAAEQDRSNWVNKQRILIEQRRNVPRQKNVPWPGSNNDGWPLTDGVIRRWKPGIMGLVLDADPVCYFFATKAEDIEAAQAAQAFYHWKFSQLPGLRRTVMELADMIAQHGMAYTRQGWDYRTTSRCRVAQAAELFPGGIEAALEAANQQIAAANQQITEAQAQGQPVAGARVRPQMDAPTFVRQVLTAEYNLSDDDVDPRTGQPTLESATEAFLQGAPYVKLYFRAIECDNLAWKALSPLDVLVPNKPCPVQHTDWVAIVHRMPEYQIQQMATDGIFPQDAAATVIDYMRKRPGQDDPAQAGFEESHVNARSGIGSVLASMEGTQPQRNNEEPVDEPLWEVYCRLDLDGSGVRKRCCVWYHAPSRTILSAHEMPFPFNAWPIVQFEFEHTSDRPYSSRGVAELLSTFQKMTNKLHNARLDAAQVLLSPMFKMRAVAGDPSRQIRFRPGGIIPVADPNDLQPLVQDFRPLVEFIREESVTKQQAEQYIGVFDGTITDPNAGNERRTAAEINAVTAQISSVFGQDATLFQAAMTEVHNQLWQIWLDFGPSEEYFRVMGEEQPQSVRKFEISRNFDIMPSGTPANTNKALDLARAREMLQLLGPDQTGLVDKRELFKAYLDRTDRVLAKRLLRSPEEAAAVQKILAAAQATSGGQQFAAF